jgi:hypothetical protein
MSEQSRIAELEDALDHILKLARNSRTNTRRYTMIAERASAALERRPFVFDLREVPKNGGSIRMKYKDALAKVAILKQALQEIVDDSRDGCWMSRDDCTEVAEDALAEIAQEEAA